MPYDGEFAAYRSLKRLADSERVKQLLSRAHQCAPGSLGVPVASPIAAPAAEHALPDFVVAIDGSHHEVDVRTGYPGAKVGYLTVASVLLDLKTIGRLDEHRPVDPVELRKTEHAATIDAALPCSNVVTRTHLDAKTAFREELYDVLHSEIIDAQDGVALLDTYEALLRLKPQSKPSQCPYTDCEQHFNVPPGLTQCPCPSRKSIWSTDAMRVHEGFREVGSNGELLGEVMQVWERVLLVHLLRALERRDLLGKAHRLAFFVDGPLAVFGHPAWLSAAIKSELQRLNGVVRAQSNRDLIILGVEKSGTFATHFEEVDPSETPGELHFGPRTYFMPTDDYIKRRIIFSESPKPYGADTYFGRKFFYKTATGARIVVNMPYLDQQRDTLQIADITLFPEFATTCLLLDALVSCRFPNSVGPLVSAHSHAAIPLNLGAKVLEQLAHALMREP